MENHTAAWSYSGAIENPSNISLDVHLEYLSLLEPLEKETTTSKYFMCNAGSSEETSSYSNFDMVSRIILYNPCIALL